MTANDDRVCPRCETTWPDDGAAPQTCPTCRPGGAEIHLVAAADLQATPPAARFMLGRALDGRFRVDGWVGGGGMAFVYRATQLSIGRPVALKIFRALQLDDGVLERRFEREAKVVAALTHPNVVQVYDYGEATLDAGGQPTLYIAMQLIDGEPLSDAIDATTHGLPVEDALHIARGILHGLAVAHDADVVHRDLKPENVMLASTPGRGAGPQVKLLDFGIAKTLGSETRLTKTGLLGTPHYMAPEQWMGGAVERRTDLYAFGCILYEMLAGRPPFDGRSPLEFAPKHVSGVVPDIPDRHPEDLPPGLSALVRRCMAKAPEDRFADAHAVLDALADPAAFAETADAVGPAGAASATASPDPVPSAHPPAPRTSRGAWALLATSVVVLAGVLVWAAQRRAARTETRPAPAAAATPIAAPTPSPPAAAAATPDAEPPPLPADAAVPPPADAAATPDASRPPQPVAPVVAPRARPAPRRRPPAARPPPAKPLDVEEL